jgi:hypothetical protein
MMYYAFVFICAATASQQIIPDSCMIAPDSWGPYITAENCNIRAAQMVEEVISGELNPLIFDLYYESGIDATYIYAEGECTQITTNNI